MSIIFENSVFETGRDNIPGVQVIGYYAPKWAIDNFPEPVTDPSSMDGKGRLKDIPGFTFKVDGFFKIYGTEGTGKLTWENTGEKNSKSYLNKFSFNYPTTEAKAKGLVRQLNNSDVVFIGAEPTGRCVVIGHPRFRTRFKINGTTGNKRNSKKGTQIEVSCSHEIPAPHYDGEILLSNVFLTTDSGFFQIVTDSGESIITL